MLVVYILCMKNEVKVYSHSLDIKVSFFFKLYELQLFLLLLITSFLISPEVMKRIFIIDLLLKRNENVDYIERILPSPLNGNL